MTVRTHSYRGVDIIEGDFADLDLGMLTPAQLSEINDITTEKRRRERAMTYQLINHAAAMAVNDGTMAANNGTGPDGTPRYAALRGALLGHRDNGAPYLTGDNSALPVTISVSHCKSAACIALGAPGTRFGIDIEEPTDRLARIADKFLSDKEKSYISGDLLLHAWTIKEAVYKAADTPGLSLRDGIDITAITPDASTTRALGAAYDGMTLRSADRCLTLCLLAAD
ncbi:MAG: 4'-phosphopantetheinyl transferase superfamily protein [Bacteroidales bacterium]|nr:4'-phosphopantetheinyl transferase superfamily protein [Bacteroidales bacterium]